MTEATVNVEIGEERLEVPAPAGHYYATVKERRLLIKDINEAQNMLLGGYLRQINGPVNYEIIMDIFGKLFLLMDNLVVDKDDMKWLEDQILVGNIMIADFAAIFHAHTTETKPVPAKKPRRGK